MSARHLLVIAESAGCPLSCRMLVSWLMSLARRMRYSSWSIVHLYFVLVCYENMFSYPCFTANVLFLCRIFVGLCLQWSPYFLLCHIKLGCSDIFSNEVLFCCSSVPVRSIYYVDHPSCCFRMMNSSDRCSDPVLVIDQHSNSITCLTQFLLLTWVLCCD